jgi:hypothetical protein
MPQFRTFCISFALISNNSELRTEKLVQGFRGIIPSVAEIETQVSGATVLGDSIAAGASNR